MWIQTDKIAADAKPGQFVSLYTNDRSKILPRPISLCEIDRENGRLRGKYLVFQYRQDGVEVCHLGDIGEECNAMLAEALVLGFEFLD